MTSRERIIRTYKRQETDKMPMVDSAWRGTINRWHKEGLPENVFWEDYFGFDKKVNVGVDNSPRFEQKVLEETDRYKIVTTAWGQTQKHFKELDSTPEVLDCYYCDSNRWQEAKERMLKYADDRIPWDYLKANYPKWKKEGRFIEITAWFGFDVTHSHMVGTEEVLVGMLDEPEWIEDMFDTYLTTSLNLHQKILDAGYEIDGLMWYDDMGYKGTPFFSPSLYKELLFPYHKKVVDWAKERGMVTKLHSCGYIEPLLPEIVKTGVDMLNPIEIKAGMDVKRIKEAYGDRLSFHGGINAQLWEDWDKVKAEMERVIPILKEGGGYMFASDHSIPSSVSFENMCKIVDLAKKLGKN